MRASGRVVAATVVAVLLSTSVATSSAAPATAAEPVERVIATVGGERITESRFDTAFEHARRERFFHGAPPAEQLHAFRQEVLDGLVARVLLLREAGRRGLEADPRAIEAALERVERRYAGDPRWRGQRERLVARLEEQLVEDELLRQLEAQVRQLPPPTEEQLVDYFRENAEKFVEPARERVSLILLAVHPSAAPAVREAAHGEARALVARLRDGADFGDLARARSDDLTAPDGGDMGYLHRGMLNARSEAAIRALEPGAITEPIEVLEGVAVFKLVERQPAQTLGFDRVRERVARLRARERGSAAWHALLESLRANTAIEIDAEFVRS